MVERASDIFINNEGIDFKSFMGMNPFGLNKERKMLPSSGVFVTAELNQITMLDGRMLAGHGVVTTYPYQQMGNYWFMPFGTEPAYLETEFRHFDRSKQVEIEYVGPQDVRKHDRHKYENQNPASEYYKYNGWVIEGKLKMPSKGNLIIRKGPDLVIDACSNNFEENKRLAFAHFRLLSYFDSSDKERLLKFIQGVFEQAVKLPEDDVRIIMVKARSKFQAA